MVQIDNEIYKNIEIKVYYNKETKCFSAYSKLGNSHNKFDSKLGNFGHGYTTPSKAIEDCKLKIDNFLKKSPKTYKELAEEITESLTWVDNNDCYADEEIIETLVESFIETRNKD